MADYRALGAAAWSAAVPGFGQLVNRKYIKGLTLIALELLINVKSGLNTIIICSFHGQTREAVNSTDYQWLMFYPCLYLFAVWDAYSDAGKDEKPLLFLPFALSAYAGTIGGYLFPHINGREYLFRPLLVNAVLFAGRFWPGFYRQAGDTQMSKIKDSREQEQSANLHPHLLRFHPLLLTKTGGI